MDGYGDFGCGSQSMDFYNDSREILVCYCEEQGRTCAELRCSRYVFPIGYIINV